MKTILVPVNYSDAAKTAIDYAVGLSKQLDINRIILYNAIEPMVSADAMSVTTDGNFSTLGLYDMEALTETNKVHLEKLKKEISEAIGNITVETLSEYNTLPTGIVNICQSQGIDIIIMGISEAGGLTETLVGSNSLDVAKHTTTPVIVVPHGATYRPIQHILFTCDYNNVSETVPVALFKSIISATGAHLYVLHVDANAETDEHRRQAAVLKNLLQDNPADYYSIQHNNFKEAVNQFVAGHNIDLIAAIPKKHHFFNGLFHHSHIKTLAFHSSVPLLLVHEKD